MKTIFKIISVIIQLAAIATGFSTFNNFMEDQRLAGIAREQIVKSAPFDVVGTQMVPNLVYEGAIREERDAMAGASFEEAAAGFTVVIFLLASMLWLLADGPSPSIAPRKEEKGHVPSLVNAA